MQLGAESRNKTIAAISLMVLALIFVVVRFFPDSPAAAKSPSSGRGSSAAGRAGILAARNDSAKKQP